MAVIQKIGQNTFNKTGFKLVSKITDVPVMQNKRLNFCDCVVLENTEGRKIKIYSQKNFRGDEPVWRKRKIIINLHPANKIVYKRHFVIPFYSNGKLCC